MNLPSARTFSPASEKYSGERCEAQEGLQPAMLFFLSQKNAATRLMEMTSSTQEQNVAETSGRMPS